MPEFDSPDAQEAERQAHRKLVDDIVLAFGLTGPIDNYWVIYRLLPEDSAKRFGEEAFMHPLYEEDGHEAVADFFKTQVNLMPYTNYIEQVRHNWQLNDLGQIHLSLLLRQMEDDPTAYTYFQDMVDNALGAELDEL